MSMFTEEELLKIGFTKEKSRDTIDGDPSFYYFTFDHVSAETLITNAKITNANDELENGGYIVEMFNVESPRALSKDFVEMYVREFN